MPGVKKSEIIAHNRLFKHLEQARMNVVKIIFIYGVISHQQ